MKNPHGLGTQRESGRKKKDGLVFVCFFFPRRFWVKENPDVRKSFQKKSATSTTVARVLVGQTRNAEEEVTIHRPPT